MVAGLANMTPTDSDWRSAHWPWWTVPIFLPVALVWVVVLLVACAAVLVMKGAGVKQ